jgi:toxin FitB
MYFLDTNVVSELRRARPPWARLVHRKPDRLVEDAMIAATATVDGLTVVTRNVRDFDRLGVAAFNPFDGKLG